MVTASGNPNPANPTNHTNPTTKYGCEFVNVNYIFALLTVKGIAVKTGLILTTCSVPSGNG